MEFFLLNLMVALFYRVLPAKVARPGRIRHARHHGCGGTFPQPMSCPHGANNALISPASSSKNEMYRAERYNRKLFYRVRQGHYLFNPTLMLRVEGEWVNIYDLLHLDKLAYQPAKTRPTGGTTASKRLGTTGWTLGVTTSNSNSSKCAAHC